MTITHISEREQALERENERYLKTINIQSVTIEVQQEELAALKAQPVQEPSAYIAFSENGEHISYWTRSLEDAQTWTGRTNKKCEPFYPAPVQPAALTDANITDALAAWLDDVAHKEFNERMRAAIEAAIKNGGAT